MPRPISFRDACAQYVHRFTMEHVPAWALKPCAGNGNFYAPHFRTDLEWYENTKFPGEKGTDLDDCYTSNQTWPLGQWLRASYTVGGENLPAESPEELASRIYGAFRNVHAAWGNRVTDAENPGDYLARELAGKPPAVAALVGFRLAQAMRDGPSGNLEAPALHALLRAIDRGGA